MPAARPPRKLNPEMEKLQARLAEVEQALEAIRGGEVDAVVVDGPRGPLVYTLQSPERPYRALFESMNEGAALISRDGLLLFCNQNLAEMAGLPPESLIGSPAADLVDSLTRLHLKNLLARAMEMGVSRDKIHLRRPDGNRVPVQASFQSIPGEDGLRICLVATDLRELEAAQSSIEKQARKYDALLSTTSDGYWRHDGDDNLLDVNDTYCAMSGYSREELLTMRTSDLEVPLPGEDLVSHYERVVEDGFERCERQHRKKNGQIYDVEVSTCYFDDTSDFLVFVRDISERKRTEAALRSALRHTRNLIEASLDPLVTISPDGKITDVNQATEESTGIPREQLIGSDFSNYFTDPEKARRGYEQTFTEGAVRDYSLRLRHASGQVIDVLYNATVFLDESGQVKGVFAAARDVTARLRAEQTLQETAAKLQTAMRFAHLGQWTLDLASGRVEWTEELYHMFGLDPSQAPPPYPEQSRIFAPESWSRVTASVDRTVTTGEPYDLELETIPFHGGRGWTLVHGEALRNAAGAITGLQGTSLDITERRQLQEELVQAQKLEAIGRLAGGVAHDFNNILGVILGYSQLLDTKIPPSEAKIHEYLGQIEKSAERAASVTRQLLAFSRKQVMQVRVVELNSIINDVSKILRRLIGENIELVIKTAEDLGTIRVDPTQLEQVLMNLAINARDAMPRGGRLLITTSAVELHEALPRVHRTVAPGKYALLSVTDTGTGMDEETISHIFEPFFTTKEAGSGTGFGLSIVYGIVKQSGGYIRVESHPGRGTTFELYLPRLASSPSKVVEIAQATPDRSRNGTILLVEDEGALSELARSVLEQDGYHVLSAPSGAEAFRIAQTYPGTIDLLLSDIVLAGMIDGIELARQLIELKPNLRVVFMSGYSDAEIKRTGPLQHIPLLEKPYGNQELRDVIHKAFNSSAGIANLLARAR